MEGDKAPVAVVLGVSANAGAINEGINKLRAGGAGSCRAAAGDGGAGIEVRLELTPLTP